MSTQLRGYYADFPLNLARGAAVSVETSLMTVNGAAVPYRIVWVFCGLHMISQSFPLIPQSSVCCCYDQSGLSDGESGRKLLITGCQCAKQAV